MKINLECCNRRRRPFAGDSIAGAEAPPGIPPLGVGGILHAPLLESGGLYHDLYERQFIAWEEDAPEPVWASGDD